MTLRLRATVDKAGSGQGGSGRRPEAAGSSPSWDRVDRILEEALAVPKDRRAEFLQSACGGDEAVRAEVDSLLQHHAPGSQLFAGLSDALTRERPRAERADLIGSRLDRYEVVRHLGGGMALVYEAWDPAEERRVVVKLPRVEVDPRAAARLVREAHTETGLAHPNICRVLDHGRTSGLGPYLVLEFCQGTTLAERLQAGLLGALEVVSLARQVASGLAAAHALHIVHRDIKPSNIMLGDGGEVKLLDFGIAKTLGERLTLSGQILGTLEYMSPEQLRGEAVAPSTDIWSLGVLMCEALTGRHPYRRSSRRATMLAIVSEELSPGDWLEGPMADRLGPVLESCLSRSPGARPGAAQLEVSLGEIEGDLKTGSPRSGG